MEKQRMNRVVAFDPPSCVRSHGLHFVILLPSVLVNIFLSIN